MVLVDVVVTDKQGKPVPGLRAEDFTLEEKVRPRRSQRLPRLQKRGLRQNHFRQGSTRTAHNIARPAGLSPLLLLDALNTAFKDQAYARLQMLKFVQQQYRPGERMAVFTLTGSLRVLQDFTSDPQILYTALQCYRPVPQEFANSTPPTSAEAGPASASAVTASLDPAATPVHGGVGDSVSKIRTRTGCSHCLCSASGR